MTEEQLHKGRSIQLQTRLLTQDIKTIEEIKGLSEISEKQFSVTFEPEFGSSYLLHLSPELVLPFLDTAKTYNENKIAELKSEFENL